MLPELTLGLDPAQAFDFTGLVALQHHPDPAGDPRATRYAASLVERWRHRPYTMLPGLVHRAEEQLRRMAAQQYFEEHGVAIHPWDDVSVRLVVDGGGVGAPVVDSLKAAGLEPIPVILTGGSQVNRREGGYTVPKGDVVAAVQLLLEGRRLQIPEELPHAETLTRELEGFRYDYSPRGQIRYGAGPAAGEDVLWRGDGSHDDLLLATAIAAWHAEEHPLPTLDPLIVASWTDLSPYR